MHARTLEDKRRIVAHANRDLEKEAYAVDGLTVRRETKPGTLFDED
jgi:hypothetical protein